MKSSFGLKRALPIEPTYCSSAAAAHNSSRTEMRGRDRERNHWTPASATPIATNAKIIPGEAMVKRQATPPRKIASAIPQAARSPKSTSDRPKSRWPIAPPHPANAARMSSPHTAVAANEPDIRADRSTGPLYQSPLPASRGEGQGEGRELRKIRPSPQPSPREAGRGGYRAVYTPARDQRQDHN